MHHSDQHDQHGRKITEVPFFVLERADKPARRSAPQTWAVLVGGARGELRVVVEGVADAVAQAAHEAEVGHPQHIDVVDVDPPVAGDQQIVELVVEHRVSRAQVHIEVGELVVGAKRHGAELELEQRGQRQLVASRDVVLGGAALFAQFLDARVAEIRARIGKGVQQVEVAEVARPVVLRREQEEARGLDLAEEAEQGNSQASSTCMFVLIG